MLVHFKDIPVGATYRLDGDGPEDARVRLHNGGQCRDCFFSEEDHLDGADYVIDSLPPLVTPTPSRRFTVARQDLDCQRVVEVLEAADFDVTSGVLYLLGVDGRRVAAFNNWLAIQEVA